MIPCYLWRFSCWVASCTLFISCGKKSLSWHRAGLKNRKKAARKRRTPKRKQSGEKAPHSKKETKRRESAALQKGNKAARKRRTPKRKQSGEKAPHSKKE